MDTQRMNRSIYCTLSTVLVGTRQAPPPPHAAGAAAKQRRLYANSSQQPPNSHTLTPPIHAKQAAAPNYQGPCETNHPTGRHP